MIGHNGSTDWSYPSCSRIIGLQCLSVYILSGKLCSPFFIILDHYVACQYAVFSPGFFDGIVWGGARSRGRSNIYSRDD